MTDEPPVSWREWAFLETRCVNWKERAKAAPLLTHLKRLDQHHERRLPYLPHPITQLGKCTYSSRLYGGNSSQIRFSRLCDMKFALTYLINRWWLYLSSHSSLLHQTANAASLFVSVVSPLSCRRRAWTACSRSFWRETIQSTSPCPPRRYRDALTSEWGWPCL